MSRAPGSARASRPVRTLVVAPEMPWRPLTGGRMRTHHLSSALAGLGPVTVAGFSVEGDSPPSQPAPFRTLSVPWEQPPLYAQMRSADPAAAERAFQILAREIAEPWIVSCYESARLEQAVRLASASSDLVLIEHSLMGRYVEAVSPELPVVLDLHNLHTREAERALARGAESDEEVHRLRAYERALIQRAALTLTVSETEAAGARELAPGAPIAVLPNGVEARNFEAAAESPSPGYLLFTGLMNYAPNVEGVRWFAREILPHVPGGILHVVGARPAEEVRALACPQLVVHGEVADTRPYQWRSEVVVVPLLSGAGTRLKILEAAACGRAIVTTSLGVEGLDLEDDRDLLIADTAPAFATAVVRLLGDAPLRARLGASARQIAWSYRWETIASRLAELVRPLLGDRG